MADPVAFLHSLAQALSVMALYPAGHPSRERAVDLAFQHGDALASGERRPFTFLEDEVVFGREPPSRSEVVGLGERLVAAGIQRLEFERKITRDEFDELPRRALRRASCSSAVDTSEAPADAIAGHPLRRRGAAGARPHAAAAPCR